MVWEYTFHLYVTSTPKKTDKLVYNSTDKTMPSTAKSIGQRKIISGEENTEQVLCQQEVKSCLPVVAVEKDQRRLSIGQIYTTYATIRT
jgi:hypothetical protein